MVTLNKWGMQNESLINILESELPPQSTLYWLLISICAAIAWVIYITYYNSRVVGIVLTVIVNKLVKFGHVHIGELCNMSYWSLKCDSYSGHPPSLYFLYCPLGNMENTLRVDVT